MSDLKLKAGVSFAPSGVPFIDKKTGFKVDAYERGIDGAISILINHRKANSPRIFPADSWEYFSPSAVKQELLRHLQDKAPHLIAGAAVPATTRTESGLPKQCVCGGVKFSPNYCKTCGSGQVQSGWICDGCGKIVSA